MSVPHRPPLLLLDTASLYYRSYFALPESMTAPDGFPHNAVRGFLTTMTRLVVSTGARQLACCWDASWRPQWRVDLMPTYKTHRLAEPADDSESSGNTETEPDTLGPQISAIRELLDAMGICRPGLPGYEADDVIASIAAQATGPVIVVTGDRDLVQVVDDAREVRVLLTANGGMERWPLLDENAVMTRFGVRPQQYVDFAVLRGDPSDGIPGVPGIGQKTAAALLGVHPDLEALLSAAAASSVDRPLTPRLASTLLAHESDIMKARVVATAVRDLAVPTSAEALGIPSAPVHPEELEAVATEWGVQRFAQLPAAR